MHICITGGTGFVGKGIVAAALNAGHTVHALVRSGSEGKLPPHPACVPFEGDSCNSSDIRNALHGCEAVIHLVGIKREQIKRTGLSYDDVDVKSAREMAIAMQQCGVRRIVLLSAGAIGQSLYVQSKARAERIVTEAGLDWTIYRPAFILAPGQQWPRLITPMVSLLRIVPGHIGNVADRAGNITREELANSMLWSLMSDGAIGKILDVPDIRRTAQYVTLSQSPVTY